MKNSKWVDKSNRKKGLKEEFSCSLSTAVFSQNKTKTVQQTGNSCIVGKLDSSRFAETIATALGYKNKWVVGFSDIHLEMCGAILITSKT